MGLGIGDYDGDGDQDLFLTNLGTNEKRNNLSLGDIRANQKQVFHMFCLEMTAILSLWTLHKNPV